ncbi:MAG: caspase family protein [Verrucomicrobiaceae bacterium]
MKALLPVILCLINTWAVHAAERYALVIGNTHYPENGVLVTPLDNCIPDARLITITLESVGFRVTKLEDATKSAMDEALLAWEEKLTKGCEAIVYFAGHGIEHSGKNYLLGTNARLKAQSRIGEEALEAETVAQAMLLAGARASILFLDCCREAPPAEWVTRGTKKRGLADVKVDGDIIIAYAAKPGDSALDQPVVAGAGVLTGHGPYAQAVARFLSTGLKHTDFFQQVRKEVARLDIMAAARLARASRKRGTAD